MLSIGEFSKICGVTTRALRHYDEIDLIKPNHINQNTGYRFYDVSQIRQMLLVNRLKDYAFSLEEIAEIISSHEKSFILKKIKAKKNELESTIMQYEKVVQQIKCDMLNLERGVDVMAFIDNIQVTIVETKAQYILFTRQRMSVNDYCKHIGTLLGLAHSNGMHLLGAPMSIYHDKEFDPDDNDTEVALPVQEENKYTRLLAGGLCATAMCNGAYSNLSHTYAKITEWISENGYEIISSPYEQYIKGPNDSQNAEDFLTQIYFPIRKQQ